MRGHPVLYLLAAAFAVASFSASANPNSTYKTPVCKLSDAKVPKVTEDNGQKVFRSLWDDQATWAKFIACVESGKTTWVEAALAIHQFSDGGAAEELDESFGENLGNNPDRILEKTAIPGSTIELDIICSGPDVDDPRFDSYALSMAEIARREKALSKVRDSALASAASECRADLENSKKDIARFYQTDQPAAKPGVTSPAPSSDTAPPT